MEAVDQQGIPQDPDAIDAGDILLWWKSWEYPPVERPTKWYAVAAGIGLGCLLYAMMTANFVFALIVIMFAAIVMVRDMRKPQKTTTYITSEGVVFNEQLYRFKDIQDFSIVYEPPEVKNLYLSFNRAFRPVLSIPLEEANPNIVRASLLPFIYENLARESESLTDTLRRVYKL